MFDVIDEESTSGSQVFARNEEAKGLAMAVKALPEDAQHFLDLRHRQGWTFAKIGDSLGISDQAARKRWNRILDSLRKKLNSV